VEFDAAFANLLWPFVVFVSAPALPDSMLPLGMAAQDNSSKLVPVQPSKFSTLRFTDSEISWVSGRVTVFSPNNISALRLNVKFGT